ncbi:MAG TPA: peptidoglycan-associated lipoprotein Pal [Thermoanaerobaculia bacterium]|nr:peptidoglycan-associated lipoprotein Pal [Thermoanaerobaculia bacterium]
MTGKRLIVLAAAILLAGSAACKPKAPATPATADRPSVADTGTRDVAPPSRPTPSADPVEPSIPTDLQELQEYAYSRGLLGDVHYGYDSADLDGAARDRISKNADFLKQQSGIVITIEGHCDERGTNEYNLALGERRATAARNFMRSLGIADSRLRTISYGEERPQCTQSNESCWQSNRRAHFRVTGRS